MDHQHHHNEHSSAQPMEHMAHSHAQHGEHQHGSPGMSHGSAKDFLRRFFIVSILLIPLALTNSAVAGFFHIPLFALGKWIQFGIATIIFGFSLVFFQHARHEIMMRKYGMMTLVSIAVGAGYLFSVASTFIPSLHTEFYLEIATLVWVLLFGHYLEARSSAAAGNALSEVAKLLPKQAHKMVDGKEEEVAIGELKVNDMVLVKPGEKVPADGEVAAGESHMNESLVSGESKPVHKGKGDTVVAGSIAVDGSLTVRLTRVGESSTIGQIQKLITAAGETKPRSARIADKAAGVLTFSALSVAILTVTVWFFVFGHSFVFAITLGITVLVIACPHALGLAIPTVTTIATSLAVKNGVFIKNLSKIEVIQKADYVVFDKTGTLTTGSFGVTNVIGFSGVDVAEVVRAAASLEQHSSHIIGQAIVDYAKAKGARLSEVLDFKNVAGKGIQGSLDGQPYAVGNVAFVRELATLSTEAEEQIEAVLSKAETVVCVVRGGQLVGMLTVADTIKPEAYETVKKLHTLGIKVAMLTGDNERVAEAVAKELKVDTFFANVLPEDKYAHLRALQQQGNIVLMVGDGVNDAPALTQADVGIAIGAGTDVAVEAGDVVLTRSNPADVVRLIVLSKKVYVKMIQNLVWALGYNIIAIPAAAGVFAAWGFFLRPEIGALIMSLSSVIVVANALLLRRVDLEQRT
ncbi:copper-translocating P-type ATPase [Candidatus Uhrbacteria bacterium CG10_big_fil_rev_8_21_14_0_10_48_11]|uniref:Copper-translocating P-type ATPase n=1 Tax=Candidatus Uhrbacteria bacterium CG10_big_fil_rev_8_21_14_0_10_48_11 TaxID=1975037 RepID=A0A2M8LFE1_9BACT|nr:MAG: copper-translocating P-type ATPase [Candidatus Uhrbacteria bacterium CG10_big_fil_rev_8_21_14_0_10_48_11]